MVNELYTIQYLQHIYSNQKIIIAFYKIHEINDLDNINNNNILIYMYIYIYVYIIHIYVS